MTLEELEPWIRTFEAIVKQINAQTSYHIDVLNRQNGTIQELMKRVTALEANRTETVETATIYGPITKVPTIDESLEAWGKAFVKAFADRSTAMKEPNGN